MQKYLCYGRYQILVAFDNVDVFCEKNVFETESSRVILESAKKLGYRLNFHAEELSCINGVEVWISPSFSNDLPVTSLFCVFIRVWTRRSSEDALRSVIVRNRILNLIFPYSANTIPQGDSWCKNARVLKGFYRTNCLLNSQTYNLHRRSS